MEVLLYDNVFFHVNTITIFFFFAFLAMLACFYFFNLPLGPGAGVFM